MLAQRNCAVCLRDTQNLAASGSELPVLSRRVGQGALQSYPPSSTVLQFHKPYRKITTYLKRKNIYF